MADLSDRKILCLFAILCFGKPRESPFLGEGCKVYHFNSNSISVQCKSVYQLNVPSTVQSIHTLFLEEVANEDFTVQLIDLPFKHLIIQKWDMSLYYKDLGKSVFTLHRRQSLTAISVRHLRALRWSDYEFEQMHIEKSTLTNIGSQRLSDVVSKRLFSHKLIALYIIDCSLLSLDDDVFSQTTNLKILTISRNVLSSIRSQSFPESLDHLWLLDLSYNNLLSLHGNLFEKFPALVELNLNGNHLTNLPYDLIKPIWFHLNLIHLLGNNFNCLNFCWTIQRESFPHPRFFYQTKCSLDYFESLTIGTMSRYFPWCLYHLNKTLMSSERHEKRG